MAEDWWWLSVCYEVAEIPSAEEECEHSVVGNRKSPSLWEPLEKLKLLSLEEVVTIDDINMNTPTVLPCNDVSPAAPASCLSALQISRSISISVKLIKTQTKALFYF